jgi:hypothetical protein
MLNISNASGVLFAFLLVASLASVYPTVEAAQTTTVYQVTSPSSAVAGSQIPIPVLATVYYNNTVPGYLLVVGILDAGLSPQQIVPGVITSSSDTCINQPELAAICAITTRSASAVEQIDFQIGGLFGGRHEPGTWQLNITSALIDPQNNLVPGSASSKLFEISLTPVSLNVVVPQSAVVSVDGIAQPAGPVVVAVGLGPHNVTVPYVVEAGPSTRLRFENWSDGNPNAFRTVVVVANTTTLRAVYVTQNMLTLVDTEGNSTGAGWYDSDTNAKFSATQSVPVTGLLGVIGGRLTFRGWYEDGLLVSNSLSGEIAMDKPHTLTAVWQVDYSIPATIVLVIIAAIVVIFLVLRRNKAVTRRGRSRRRRTRS